MDHGIVATQAFASAMYHLGKTGTAERERLLKAFYARMAVAEDRIKQDRLASDSKQR